jgi:glycerol-3-phosphate dehydrogenase
LTAHTPLPGAKGLSPITSERLVRIYGGQAADIIKLSEEKQELKEVFDQETGAIAAEVVFAFRKENAQTLSDCLMRRTMVGLNTSAGLNAVESAAQIAQKHLGWREARMAQDIEAYREYVRRFHPAAMRQS